MSEKKNKTQDLLPQVVAKPYHLECNLENSNECESEIQKKIVEIIAGFRKGDFTVYQIIGTCCYKYFDTDKLEGVVKDYIRLCELVDIGETITVNSRNVLENFVITITITYKMENPWKVLPECKIYHGRFELLNWVSGIIEMIYMARKEKGKYFQIVSSAGSKLTMEIFTGRCISNTFINEKISHFTETTDFVKNFSKSLKLDKENIKLYMNTIKTASGDYISLWLMIENQ